MNWRYRLQTALDPAHSIEIEDERHLGLGNHRAAAVLIPITDRIEPGVILTQRPTWLRNHAGQVAFPGGKVDEGDESPVAAALREAHEELNILPAQVEVIGVADTYFSGSGYSIEEEKFEPGANRMRHGGGQVRDGSGNREGKGLRNRFRKGWRECGWRTYHQNGEHFHTGEGSKVAGMGG